MIYIPRYYVYMEIDFARRLCRNMQGGTWRLKNRIIDTDVLIIGGGTAGCFAGITLGKKKDLDVLIVEKANIVRSGCLAAGVNAINAYITKGRVPQDYVDYCKKDADGIVREDLLLSMSERLNHVTKVMEDLGLVILKDGNGDYVARGNRNIKINGENIKPILADVVKKQDNVTVINHLNITDFIVENNEIKGAYGFDVNNAEFYEINAKAVLVATGGAAGLYRPNNPGFSRHKMWYPPFNTGAGYAMGINAGAEMTTFEMRFIALRCKDTIAPTGTIAQGVPAKQLNSNGEVYENKYGLTTSQRLYGTVTENREGRGPCYLGTKGISKEQEEDLYKAYLNMAPSQTLKWLEAAGGPSEENVEIEGTEPYIVGGHTASGYWVDNNRETTIHGLFAAGDVAGGCPQKYVTGALAEGEIAAQAIAERLEGSGKGFVVNEVADSELSENAFAKKSEYERFLNNKQGLVDIEQTEEAMQKIMDQYAGGISTDYQYNEARLELADEKIKFLEQSIDNLAAQDADDLLRIYEIRERLTVCRSVIAHLKARKETRWHSFAENMDYPAKSDDWLKYVNSRKENGEIKIIIRDLVRGGDSYEHSDK
jgi:adenylylsulfate reductase subunit A